MTFPGPALLPSSSFEAAPVRIAEVAEVRRLGSAVYSDERCRGPCANWKTLFTLDFSCQSPFSYPMGFFETPRKPMSLIDDEDEWRYAAAWGTVVSGSSLASLRKRLNTSRPFLTPSLGGGIIDQHR